MKFLFDTNILIQAEPTGHAHVEPSTAMAVALLGSLEEGAHQVYVHPASVNELAKDKNVARRDLRKVLLAKYLSLPAPPRVSSRISVTLGTPTPGSHDEVDHLLLAAIDGDTVDFLVTEDRGLLKAAARVGLDGRVLSLAESIGAVRRLFPRTPSPPPAVRKVLAHQLDESDAIFSSFRHDYPHFDNWLQKCRREHRTAWVIDASDGSIAAFCIVKHESHNSTDHNSKKLKICSFKVSDRYRGYSFGELLLKSVFSYILVNDYPVSYVTVFDKYSDLVRLFEDFGFERLDSVTAYGEIILTKSFSFSRNEFDTLSNLEFHIRFGPGHLKAMRADCMVVPIRPQYHQLLFPDVQEQQSLLAGQQAFGNSIRKAYLCNAAIRQVRPGTILLFYRSTDYRTIQCVGIVGRDARFRSPRANRPLCRSANRIHVQ
ncbi:MAG: GNAT family N-acetyltransferase [Candidatus Rokuibacteriota bacterium]